MGADGTAVMHLPPAQSSHFWYVYLRVLLFQTQYLYQVICISYEQLSILWNRYLNVSVRCPRMSVLAPPLTFLLIHVY